MLVTIVLQNGIAYGDAFVADVGPGVITRRRDELADNVLTFMTKGTTQRIVRPSALHTTSLERHCRRGYI